MLRVILILFSGLFNTLNRDFGGNFRITTSLLISLNFLYYLFLRHMPPSTGRYKHKKWVLKISKQRYYQFYQNLKDVIKLHPVDGRGLHVMNLHTFDGFYRIVLFSLRMVPFEIFNLKWALDAMQVDLRTDYKWASHSTQNYLDGPGSVRLGD